MTVKSKPSKVLSKTQREDLETIVFTLEEGEVIAELGENWNKFGDSFRLASYRDFFELCLFVSGIDAEDVFEALNYPAFAFDMSELLPPELASALSSERFTDPYGLGQLLLPVISGDDVDNFLLQVQDAVMTVDEDLGDELRPNCDVELEQWFSGDRRRQYLLGLWKTSLPIREKLSELRGEAEGIVEFRNMNRFCTDCGARRRPLSANYCGKCGRPFPLRS